MFLLSATFFPLSRYPEGLQWVVAATPLYQGVVLERALVLGDVSWALVVPVVYLAAMGAACRAVAGRRMERMLKP
jgi:lipooligosaccharide transport system permease protein